MSSKGARVFVATTLAVSGLVYFIHCNQQAERDVCGVLVFGGVVCVSVCVCVWRLRNARRKNTYGSASLMRRVPFAA